MSARLPAIALLLPLAALAQPARPWTVAFNDHFEIYSQVSPESAYPALAWFEHLRAWLIRETGLRPDRIRPARVIGFASAAEYAPYRLRPSVDAYYIGTESRDTIVMTLAGPAAFGIA